VRTKQVQSLVGFDAVAVNAAGVLAGTAGSADNPSADGGPALWRDGTATPLPGLRTELTRGGATGVSADGRLVVGESWSGMPEACHSSASLDATGPPSHVCVPDSRQLELLRKRILLAA
jgi:hypothetical protein